jgi:nicotinate-nucleotide adenylyltransferase
MINGPPIGVLGGSFDPVHYGHLHLAKEAYSAAGLSEVRFVPLNTPAHKNCSTTGIAEKCDMLKTVMVPPFVLDLVEIERGGVSYTIDTLRQLRSAFPARPLCLVLGRDAFSHLASWKDYQQLLDFCHLVVVARAEFDEAIPDELAFIIKGAVVDERVELHRNLSGKVFFVDAPLVEISSSDVRKKLLQRQSIDELVPDSVLDIINNKGLYRG